MLKAWCVLISASLPKTPFPRERLCMLGWLCICAIVVVCCRCVLHRLCSTTCMRPCIEPFGIHARHPCRGRIRGLASLRPALGLRPKPHFYKLCRFFDRLRRHDICRTAHIYCFLIVIQRTMCVYPCFTQILPVTVITAVPGVTETVPSVFVANVAAGTSIAPAVVSNTPVASL